LGVPLHPPSVLQDVSKLLSHPLGWDFSGVYRYILSFYRCDSVPMAFLTTLATQCFANSLGLWLCFSQSKRPGNHLRDPQTACPSSPGFLQVLAVTFPFPLEDPDRDLCLCRGNCFQICLF
jgi:hypothetical protein